MTGYQNYFNRIPPQQATSQPVRQPVRPGLQGPYRMPMLSDDSGQRMPNKPYMPMVSLTPDAMLPKNKLPFSGQFNNSYGQFNGSGGGSQQAAPALPPQSTIPPTRPVNSPQPFLLAGNKNDPQGMNQMLQMLWQQLLGGMGGMGGVTQLQPGMQPGQGWDQRFQVAPLR